MTEKEYKEKKARIKQLEQRGLHIGNLPLYLISTAKLFEHDELVKEVEKYESEAAVNE
ncbi:hypothetical protein [Bacillus thuringiensis]|uniref:hypothetical protein n=1 Tax=Bacillus thuringiensis TaxID=1428 RepID=UPI0012ABE311|nr:hypothetical protein [Bacillus thuringiensis]